MCAMHSAKSWLDRGYRRRGAGRDWLAETTESTTGAKSELRFRSGGLWGGEESVKGAANSLCTASLPLQSGKRGAQLIWVDKLYDFTGRDIVLYLLTGRSRALKYRSVNKSFTALPYGRTKPTV